MEHDKFTGKYGETNRIFFQDSDGREVRLLVRGNTFISALEAYISTGEKILVFKNEKGYWMFDLPSE